jgi:hypothetical protein
LLYGLCIYFVNIGVCSSYHLGLLMQFEALSHFFYIDIDHLKLNTPILLVAAQSV